MDLESRLRLADDVPAVEEFLSSTAGRLHHRVQDPDGLFWAEVQPNNGERAAFIARIEWKVYPDRPPSLVFVESIGASEAEMAVAWPEPPVTAVPPATCASRSPPRASNSTPSGAPGRKPGAAPAIPSYPWWRTCRTISTALTGGEPDDH